MRSFSALSYLPLVALSQFLDYDKFNSYADIDFWLRQLGADVFGLTHEGRNLRVYEKTSFSNDKTIAIQCGAKGNDQIGVASCIKLIDELSSGRNPDFDQFNWQVIPLLNPDGYDYSQTSDRFWSKNRQQHDDGVCIGTSIQNNFNTSSWGYGEVESNPCSDRFPGAVAGSEKETEALESFFRKPNNVPDLFLSVEGDGELVAVSWPFSSDQKSPYWNELEPLARKIAQSMSQIGRAKYAWTQGTLAGGRPEDHVHEIARLKNIPSFSMNILCESCEEAEINPAYSDLISGVKMAVDQLSRPYYPNFRNIFDYVAWDDGMFEWNVVDSKTYDGFDFYTLNMTAQQWLTDRDVRAPVWWHLLCVAVPHNLDPEMAGSALLIIDGGFNPSSGGNPILPEENLNAAFVGKIAKESGAIAANIYFVPNQRVYFVEDWDEYYINRGRGEDAIIAYTWKRFIDTPNLGPQIDEPHWLLRFPMVKSVVKGMDALSQFNMQEGREELSKFTITGASKRGWTTWITGGVDPRVNAIMPAVETFVGMSEVLHGHFQALGGWSFAFADYMREELTKYMDTFEFDEMCKHVDPLSYKENLTMPIYAIMAAGDEFFLPTDAKYFYDKLPGKVYLRTMPNCEHEMVGQGRSSPFIQWAMTYFFMAVNKGLEIPQISWNQDDDDQRFGLIAETTGDWEAEGRFAQTRGNTRLDFRLARARYDDDPELPDAILDELGFLENIKIERIWWNPKNPTQLDENRVKVSFPKTDEFYQATFFQVTHHLGINEHTGLPMNFTQTTLVHHYPYEYPNEDCFMESCLGTLV